METKTRPYDELLTLLREASLLGGTASILSWDQETMMPSAAVGYRAQQMAQLSGLIHRMATDPRIGELLDRCEADDDMTSDPDAAAILRETRHHYERATKLPAELVTERAEVRARAQHEWQEARQDDDFERFRPWLERNLELARRVADHYGWEAEPWDALADGYERGMTAASVEAVFTPLRDRLRELLATLMDGPRRPDERFAAHELPVDAQRAFVRRVAERIGFDFSRGRLDESTHPFCGGSHRDDVRMTTRFRPDGFLDSLAATMHEAGHGIYEQGIPSELMLTPIGGAASLGIHESQSRMWENQVGRSEGFWRWCWPLVEEHFGSAVDGFTWEAAHHAANVVRPSLIRVEADEATYNMHIMIRFELERALMNGSLAAADVPDAWNERYREYLDVEVPDDTRGCLQDIHWAFGGFGYFPTYTLGNLYCAQLFEAACEQVPGLVEGFARGEFGPLKQWLNDNVHAHGGRHEPKDLCERVTGKPLSADPLLRHLEGKLRPLYGV
ncbi:MAG TPA: carboxypeptidase M32 [Actinomycetota bacterium]|nr:carboxypeptidase M32 [Actinomycetota bacterium]